MTTSQMRAERGEVWLVRFPFTDLSSTRGKGENPNFPFPLSVVQGMAQNKLEAEETGRKLREEVE